MTTFPDPKEPPAFTLEPEELSTPAGLAAACQRAREFVEKHVPGRHRPGPGAYFYGYQPYGCRCAIGYLHAAIAGELVAWMDSTLERLGPKGQHRIAFEYGFDAAWNWNGTARAAAIADAFPDWKEAGSNLGRAWRSQG